MTGPDRRTVLASVATATLMPVTAMAKARPPFPPDAVIRVTAPGGKLYARVNGRLDGPRPPLIMTHGGPGGCHAAFIPALPLADDRAVILYDQLDCGFSDAPGDPANWTVVRFAAEVEAVRAAFGLTRFHLLGASWGGTVALEYAATRPPQLASLVLQGPLVSTAAWIADAAALRAQLPKDVQAILLEGDRTGRTDGPGYAAAADVFYAQFFRRRPPPDWQTTYDATIPNRFNQMLYETMWGPNEFVCSGTLRAYDGTPRLGDIAVPSLFLVGDHDEARAETVTGFAARMAEARVEVIADAGHRIQTDNNADYLASLRRWLRAHD